MPNRRMIRNIMLMGKQNMSTYISSLAPLVYWKLNETSGTAALNYGTLATANGLYVEAVVAQTPAPGGGFAPLFDGTNDRCNVYTAALVGAMPEATGSIVAWAKVLSSAVWTDGAERYVFEYLKTPGNNWACLFKGGDNLMHFQIDGATAAKTISMGSVTPLSWMMFALTWDSVADEMKAYYNGLQVGVTTAGFGSITGTLNLDYAIIGANDSTGFNPWKGYLSQQAIWTSVLAPGVITEIYRLGAQ